MIVDFACSETQKIWQNEMSYRLPTDMQQLARRKLRMLHQSHWMNDLQAPPNHQLEKLKGARAGQYSTTINQDWRICFRWFGDAAHRVEIVSDKKLRGNPWEDD